MISPTHRDVDSREPKKIRLVHKAHSSTQADIWLVSWNGQDCVLRDYSSPRAWCFRLLCRWAVRREVRVHRLLAGVEGIPRLVAVLDTDHYLIEFIEGKPLSTWRKESPGMEIIRRLGEIVDRMHERGVAHGDIRNKNVLITPDGMPYLVDFSTAWWGTSWWRKPLFRFYRLVDRQRLARTKVKFEPSTLSEEERQLVDNPPFYLRLGRFYRHGIYQAMKRKRGQAEEEEEWQ